MAGNLLSNLGIVLIAIGYFVGLPTLFSWLIGEFRQKFHYMLYWVIFNFGVLFIMCLSGLSLVLVYFLSNLLERI